MDLMTVIRKAAEGVALEEAERQLLHDYQPGDSGALEKRNRELAARLEAYETRDLPEHERIQRKMESDLAALREQLESATGERNRVREELQTMQFRQEVGKLAAHSHFSDPEYLEYLCRKEGIAPEAGPATDEFLGRLRETLPRFFKLELQPGTGVPGAATSRGEEARSIAGMIADAPAIQD